MMKLTIIPQEQFAARSSARWGDIQHDETLLDLIRAEVTARGICPRWPALRRLEQALGEEKNKKSDRLRELCDLLEYEGDLTLSSGGVLHVTPVRAIRFQEGVHRIVCSLPSRRLRAHLPGKFEIDGVRRFNRFDSTEEAERAVHELGGVVLSPQAWAGLDLTPIADRSWLDGLEQRLEWRSQAAGSLERDGALEWHCLALADDGPRWRRKPAESSRLWRARTSYGRWIWAWATEDGPPSSKAFIKLFADEANRTLFALARDADRNVSAAMVRDDSFAHLRLREWLPRAEYRYLSSFATASRIEHHQQWSIPVSCVDDVLNTLSRRLGLDIKEEAPA